MDVKLPTHICRVTFRNDATSGVVQVQFLRFSEIPPEEWVPGGIKILTYETKIAEMKLSELSKNDFQISKNQKLSKSVE